MVGYPIKKMLSSLTAASKMGRGHHAATQMSRAGVRRERLHVRRDPDRRTLLTSSTLLAAKGTGPASSPHGFPLKTLGVRAAWLAPAERTTPGRIDFGRSKARCALPSAAAIGQTVRRYSGDFSGKHDESGSVFFVRCATKVLLREKP